MGKTSSEKLLDQIPEDWFELLDRNEIQSEIVRVADNLLVGISKQLNLEKANKDKVMAKLSKKWNLNINESIAYLRATIMNIVRKNLFNKNYGDLFPEKSIHLPETIKFNNSEEKILISDPVVYKPRFETVEIDYVDEIKRQELPEKDSWSFEIYLKNGTSQRYYFEDLKSAELLYIRMFDLLEQDRGTFSLNNN